METAKSFVNEGQASVAGFEEESIIVAADATIESRKTLWRKLAANTGFIVDLSGRLAAIGGVLNDRNEARN